MCYNEQNRYSCGCEEKGERQTCVPKMADKQQECTGPTKKVLILPYPCKRCRRDTWLKRLEGKLISRERPKKLNETQAQEETVNSVTYEGTIDLKKGSGEMAIGLTAEETTTNILVPSIKVDTAPNAGEDKAERINAPFKATKIGDVDDFERKQWEKRRNRFSWTPTTDISDYATKNKATHDDDDDGSVVDRSVENENSILSSGALLFTVNIMSSGEQDGKTVKLGQDRGVAQPASVPLDDVAATGTKEKTDDDANEHIQAAPAPVNKVLTAIKGAKKPRRGGGAVLKALFCRLLTRARRLKNRNHTDYIKLRGDDESSSNAAGSENLGTEHQSSTAATGQEITIDDSSREGSYEDQEFGKNARWPAPVKPRYIVDSDDTSL
ncbi:hypothetical protein B7463_g4943, partial [Scytalidium lignicola]